jgi:hypothetical protein
LNYSITFVSEQNEIIMKTHWKKLNNPNYIGAYSLMNGEDSTELVVQIESVKQEEVTGVGNRKEDCLVAQLKGQKPFILNSTNAKTIEAIADSPYIEDWAGLRITLYVARVSAFGSEVDALRVRKQAPKLPELTPKHKRWDGAKKGLASGKVTIEQIKASFILSSANEKLLTK